MLSVVSSIESLASGVDTMILKTRKYDKAYLTIRLPVQRWVMKRDHSLMCASKYKASDSMKPNKLRELLISYL